MAFWTCLNVLPPRHCSGRGILVATTWRTVLVGVLACRLFGTLLRALATCITSETRYGHPAVQDAHLVRRGPQDPFAKMPGDGTSNGSSGEPRRNTPRDQTTPFHDSNHATARSASGRRLSSTLRSRSRITPASTSPASSRAATKFCDPSLELAGAGVRRCSQRRHADGLTFAAPPGVGSTGSSLSGHQTLTERNGR